MEEVSWETERIGWEGRRGDTGKGGGGGSGEREEGIIGKIRGGPGGAIGNS